MVWVATLLAFGVFFGGPCVFAAVTVALTARFVAETSALQGLLVLALGLVVAQGVVAAGCSAVLRWCFVSVPVRGAALLSALVVSLGLLSAPTLSSIAPSFLGADGRDGALCDLLLSMIVEFLTFGGLALSAAMVCVLLVEVPVRWALGDQRFLDDGTLRAMRCIGSLLVISAGSAVIKEEGIARLLKSIQP